MNTVVTIYETNLRAELLSDELPGWIHWADWFFLSLYVGEFLVKLYIHGLWFFFNDHFAWNLADFVIVFFGVLDKVVEAVLEAHVIDLDFFRIFRVLKIGRIMRVVRAFEFMRELVMLVKCVLGSMLALFWSVLFLLLILMIASLMFMQATTQFQIDHPFSTSRDTYEPLFGDVGNTMLTLFQSTTGGRDWGEMYSAVAETGTINAFLFIAYIFFFTFAFINIVISIFMDKAMRLAEPDGEERALQKRHQQIERVRELKEFLQME